LFESSPESEGIKTQTLVVTVVYHRLKLALYRRD